MDIGTDDIRKWRIHYALKEHCDGVDGVSSGVLSDRFPLEVLFQYSGCLMGLLDGSR